MAFELWGGLTSEEMTKRIKELKNTVDVLTLSATPIPRTLQMSLVGVRTLSQINTAPRNRVAVQTYVTPYNELIIKELIEKELSRSGQTFYVYNNVSHIYSKVSKLARLVPGANIGVVHGQMEKEEIEDVMIKFYSGEINLLVCTSVIENGIDVPNANMIIVENADRFGLSQLYQIRGRVGRSNKIAYSYLMYNKGKILSDIAKKRLNVIKEFTELGSGFSIANRDLSIRGAGDILGSEQAGFIDSIGIDLYLKMLNDEINNLQNEPVINDAEEESFDTKPLLNVSTHIDNSYVFEDDLKIEIHQKINSIKDRETFENVKLELEDRFGTVSEDILVYMYEEWFERLIQQLKIKTVHQNKNSIELVFTKDLVEKMDTEELFMEAYGVSNMFRFISRGTNLIIVLDIIRLEKHPVYYLVELLDKIYDKFGKNID